MIMKIYVTNILKANEGKWPIIESNVNEWPMWSQWLDINDYYYY